MVGRIMFKVPECLKPISHKDTSKTRWCCDFSPGELQMTYGNLFESQSWTFVAWSGGLVCFWIAFLQGFQWSCQPKRCKKRIPYMVVSSSYQSSQVINTSVRTSKAPEFILRKSTHELNRSVPERVSSMTDVQVSIPGSWLVQATFSRVQIPASWRIKYLQ